MKLKVAWCTKNFIENHYFIDFNLSNLNNRDIEKAGVKELLKKQFGLINEIQYNHLGSPYLLNNDLKISISHSKKLIAVAVCSYPIGIDLEEISSRAVRIQHRFLTEKEIYLFGDTDEKATLAWTIKEALYKICDQSKVIFKEDLKIINEIENGKSYLCEFPWKGIPTKVICKSIQLNNHILTYNEAF